MKWLNRFVPKWVFNFYPIWRWYKCPHCDMEITIRGIPNEFYECPWCEGVYMKEHKND